MRETFPARSIAVMFALGTLLRGGASNTASGNEASSIRVMDFKALPSDAESHNRTKWSRDLYIYIDDDVVSPSLFVFDRSGKQIYNSLLQIPGVDRMRVDDFEAAPDGTLWLCGSSHAAGGQASSFLAHITNDGQDVHFTETSPYQPNQLSVAPDGTVWTAGLELIPGVHDSQDRAKLNASADTLRHYDSRGKLLASAVPAASVGDRIRMLEGFLRANQDRVGWSSGRDGTYIEFSPDLRVLNSFPPAPTTNDRNKVEGFALTPAGNCFLVMAHSSPNGRVATLYQLDRGKRTWVEMDVHQLGFDVFPMLEGNDGEALVFMGPPDKSKLRIVSLSLAGVKP